MKPFLVFSALSLSHTHPLLACPEKQLARGGVPQIVVAVQRRSLTSQTVVGKGRGEGGKAKGGKHEYDSPEHTVHTDCHHRRKKKRRPEDEIREGEKKRKEKGRQEKQ